MSLVNAAILLMSFVTSSMQAFGDRMGTAVSDPNKKGYLVSVLELGAWFGVLVTGYLADKLSRKYTIVVGECTSKL